jgi:hypothetical protein
MTCHRCEQQHTEILAAFPAGDPMADLRAASRASAERERTPTPIHIHYDAVTGLYVVVSTTEKRLAA